MEIHFSGHGKVMGNHCWKRVVTLLSVSDLGFVITSQWRLMCPLFTLQSVQVTQCQRSGLPANKCSSATASSLCTTSAAAQGYATSGGTTLRTCTAWSTWWTRVPLRGWVSQGRHWKSSSKTLSSAENPASCKQTFLLVSTPWAVKKDPTCLVSTFVKKSRDFLIHCWI